MSSPFQKLYPPQRLGVAVHGISLAISRAVILHGIRTLMWVIVLLPQTWSMADEVSQPAKRDTRASSPAPTAAGKVTVNDAEPADSAASTTSASLEADPSPLATDANSPASFPNVPPQPPQSPPHTSTESGENRAEVVPSASKWEQLFNWLAQGMAPPASSSIEEKALAELTASWDFQRSGDRNLDNWPDDWKRTISRAYPRYLPIGIAARNQNLEQASVAAGQALGKIYLGWKRNRPPSRIVLESLPPEIDSLFDATIDRCLELKLDGGAIDLCSPAVPIEARFYYSLQLDMQTEGLTEHQAWAQLEILNDKQELISVHPTSAQSGSTHWHKFEVNALQDRPNNAAKFGRVRIKVEGPKSSSASGIVKVDRIRIWKVPRIRMTLDRPANIFKEGEKVRIRVITTGLSEENRNIRFELLNRYGQHLESESIKFERPKSKEIMISTELADLGMNQYSDLEVDGEAIWLPQVSEPGFYTARVELGKAANQTLYRVISFAIINNDTSDGQGRFGWSFSSRSMPNSFNHLPTLAQQATLGWIKVPIWYDPHDAERSDEYAWLIDRIQNLGMRCIGILDQPPEKIRDNFASTGTANAAQVFQDPAIWQPQLDPVLTRMSLSLVLFQLGADHDLSFQGYSNLTERLSEIRKHFQGFGQDIQVGLPWNWLDYSPPSPDAKNTNSITSDNPSDFITLRTNPPLTSEEMDAYVGLLTADAHNRWINIDPLDARYYSSQHRIQNLAERMLVTAKNRVEAAFVSDPIDEYHGLMLPDGSPTILFLPWRTLAHHLTGAYFIGSFSLPGGSQNYVFEREGQAILIGWNNNPTKEQLYLGEMVSIADLWGNVTAAETIVDTSFREQVIEFGPEPIVVTGLNLPIARWRISFQLANSDVQQPGTSIARVNAGFSNGFDQSVVGSLEIFAPELIHDASVKKSFDLAEQQNISLTMDLNLRPDASTGKQMVTAIFDLQAGSPYRFRVFHPLYVGAQDIEVELSYEIDADGNLLIRQDLVNNTNKILDFECTLFVPDRVHRRQQILQIPPGQATRYYRLENGNELKGKTLWLRCKQLDTGRFLNYRAEIDW